MPLVRITVRDDTSSDTQQAIADGVHRAMVAAIGIPSGDRFQVIDGRPADALIADPEYLGVARQNPVFVEITLAPGRTVERKQSLYQGIAKQLESAGVRVEDVIVVLHENPRENWSLGNGEAQMLDTELLKRWGWTPPGS
jgi:phenylpyruvate tautomerase PptA (4-oxalocrotonate tautomerase family)